MNQPPSYMDVGSSHLSHASVTSAAPGPGHYASYGQTGLHNSVPSYGSSPVGYGYGGYHASIPSLPSGSSSTGSMNNHLVQQPPLTLPTLATNTPAPSGGPNMQSRAVDTSGQVAPPGMKPRVTATLWEDEGSLCFQVEAQGVCVARREDNHMINGTKLLNVAGMTRGRRDGILKSEKTRHVVKIGPMHLKGVWIPFERALDFANKEKITESLYPLFVHNIGALLYHPTNQARNNPGAIPAMSPQDRRREPQSDYMRSSQSSQPPSLSQHQSMTTPAGSAPHSIAPNPASGRPGLDRAHTFPNPPSGASNMVGMGSTSGSYEWGSTGVSMAPSSQGLSIDTNMHNPRSVPTTPASTPPANNMHSMPNYQTSGPYENSRSIYGHAPSSSFSSQYSMGRYGQVLPSPGVKHEMGPPPRTGHEDEKRDSMYSTHNDHPQSGDDGDHEGDYTHASGAYGQTRHAYGYGSHSNAAPLNHDQSHASPDLTGSPQKGSGRATPRTTGYSQGYSTPQRQQQLPASNLYNAMGGNSRPVSNADLYHTGYSQNFSSPNGVPSAKKRGYEMDDNDQMNGLKRAKTMHDRNPPPMLAAQSNR